MLGSGPNGSTVECSFNRIGRSFNFRVTVEEDEFGEVMRRSTHSVGQRGLEEALDGGVSEELEVADLPGGLVELRWQRTGRRTDFDSPVREPTIPRAELEAFLRGE